MTHRVFLGVGSNIDAEKHIGDGLDEIDQRFRIIRISSVYQSDAVGFDGAPFLNLVVEADTEHATPVMLHRALRQIEYRYGRDDDAGKFAPRTLDIDILTFDQLKGDFDGIPLPRAEATEQAFVLAPFAEIAPDTTLPGSHQSLAELWADFSKELNRDGAIERKRFLWRTRSLPFFNLSPIATRESITL